MGSSEVQVALLFRRESLLRGVAELMVIVVGVLITLWAEQWWAAKTDLAAVAKSGFAATDSGDPIAAGYASSDSLIGPAIGIEHIELMRDREFRGVLAFRIVMLAEQMESYVKLKAQLNLLREQLKRELES